MKPDGVTYAVIELLLCVIILSILAIVYGYFFV